MDRLVGGKAGLLQRVADGLRGGEELAETKPWERLARCEATGGFGEQASEVQRETENSGGWRSDCATTQ